ncbi:MAG: hypothetical protein GSR78_05465 [Desulfurococcales archaeon]|nr:hypothetical protein [Desulfurococcales archaeon]
MAGRIVVEIDMGRYKSVELDLDEAERLLREVTRRLGYESNDASETFRIIRNFDAFYETMKKKFKDHIAPNKSMNDMIRGTVIVDRVKLSREGDKRRITIVFDRRVPDEVIKESLEALGYEVEVKRLQIT